MRVDENPANPFRAKLAAGCLALGLPVRIVRGPEIVRVARATGHDFLFIDTQHGVFDVETIASLAQTAASLGVAPLVRARGAGDPDAARLLDAGVAGIVWPDVSSAEEARHCVEVCRFPPLGLRSLGGAAPMLDFLPMPAGQAIARLESATIVVCMLETRAGLAEVDAIAAVEGVDVLHLGTNDLLASLGKPGRFDDPEILAAQDAVISACRRHAKVAGCGGNRDVARQAAAIVSGARFVTTQTDAAFLVEAAGTWTKSLLAAVEAS
jgi:staphyloferrin B biosynthesis citrate synthase